MSELARRRSARDIWISRGHLYAMGLGAGLSVLMAFAAGFGLGRESVELPPPVATAFAGEAGDDALIELLARVDAAATPDGGVRELTFPDALRGEMVEGSGRTIEVESGEASFEGRTIAVPEAGDAPPEGAWTIVVATFPARAKADARTASLREEGVEAWTGVERAGGEVRYRVGIGGYGSRVSAEDAVEELTGSLAEQAEVVRY